MTNFLATLHDLRYVIATALLIWAAAWTWCKVRDFDRRAEERRRIKDAAKYERLLAAVESPEPLPPVDATEAEFEAWALRAVRIANDRSYDRALAEIRALPEIGETA